MLQKKFHHKTVNRKTNSKLKTVFQIKVDEILLLSCVYKLSGSSIFFRKRQKN